MEKSILATFIYFDILKRPLKKNEILDNLQRIDGETQFSLVSFGEALLNLLSKNLIENEKEFWFLKGRDFLVIERKKREKISKELWQRLKKIASIINWVPFIEGVFVSGSLAIDNSNETSDIDLLVITKIRRIFTVRAFLTFLLDVFRYRRKKGKIRGKICLNHYQTLDFLEFKFPSLYVAYNFFHLRPVIDRKNVFERFKEENRWLKGYLLFWEKQFPSSFQIKKRSKIAKLFEWFLKGSFGSWLEKKLKEIQIKRKLQRYPSGVKSGRVILNDFLIEDHPYSPEEKIIQKYRDLTSSFGLDKV